MKTKFVMTCLIVGTLAGPVVAWAEDQDTDRASPTAYVKDSAITTEIKTKLAADHITSLGRISVDTDQNGVVYLSGTARSQEAIDKAIATSKDTKGVKSVKSTLTIKQDD
jgi:hyperosmotically inducible protein